jgi:hypothetical protein
MNKRIVRLLIAGVALIGSASANAWNCDRWDNDDKEIFKNYAWPEECVPVYDPLLPDSPLLGDFCYAATGTLRVHELRNRTITRFAGSGTANLYAPGTHTEPGTGTSIGNTLFALKNRTVALKTDTVKSFRMSFDSNQFQVGSGAECRVISVEMKFTGRNQIGCADYPSPSPGAACQNPVFDFTRDATDVVVAPCPQ